MRISYTLLSEAGGDGVGVDVVSYAKCEDVKSISTERLVHLIGAVGGTEINDITVILARLLAM